MAQLQTFRLEIPASHINGYENGMCRKCVFGRCLKINSNILGNRIFKSSDFFLHSYSTDIFHKIYQYLIKNSQFKLFAIQAINVQARIVIRLHLE